MNQQNQLFNEIDVITATNGSLGFKLGHATDNEAKTGVSVIYFPNGAKVGCDISGGGPASRETPLTMPLTADNPVNSIVFSGGSAYGLAASDGVMKCLEDNGIGYDTGIAKIPLVCQSCIFDLGYGDSHVRPDYKMGYEACTDALNRTAADFTAGNDVEPKSRQISNIMGNVGAGAGATVGKIGGMSYAQKSGLGIHSVRIGKLTLTAVVVVNALGDIFNPKTGEKIAGFHKPDRSGFADSITAALHNMLPKDPFTGNTTIGAVITNAEFSKAEMGKIASMTRNAYARCINPVGTMADGDTIYAASVPDGEEHVKADINIVGTLAAEVMSAAILKAVKYSHIPDEEYLKNI